MEKWTQEELEELYAKITEKVKKDREFRKELKARPKEVIEKLAGRELPEGFNVQLIEKRGNAEKEFGVPDFSGSEMDLSELKKVSGGAGEEDFSGSGDCPEDVPMLGISILAIISACAAAISIVSCGADVCAAAGCPVDEGCGAHGCGADGCGAQGLCAADGCGAAGCGEDAICAADGCAAEGCGADSTEMPVRHTASVRVMSAAVRHAERMSDAVEMSAEPIPVPWMRTVPDMRAAEMPALAS